MRSVSRRSFLAAVGTAGLASRARSAAPACFSVAPAGGRWWLRTPTGAKFFSIALNHIDPAPLRTNDPDNRWRQRYGNSMQRWLIEAVRPDLDDWGFNGIGWTQEVAVRGPQIHRHSPSFTFEEYQWLDRPYCHLLPFAELHQWEAETRLPDFFSPDFAEWCDYVAKSQCVRFADDPKLIGYFYTDCPTWVHDRPENRWRGPIFPPSRLQQAGGKEELHRLATKYYQVTHDAIRRYDPHHLILGDRYEANAPLPLEVLEAAKPFVDVFCFQDFKDPVGQLLDWHRRTGKPVLWADGAKNQPAVDPTTGEKFMRNDGRWYAEVLRGLRSNPGCVGVHLCGAYLRNSARRRGLRDANEQVDQENVALIRKANQELSDWVRQQPGE